MASPLHGRAWKGPFIHPAVEVEAQLPHGGDECIAVQVFEGLAGDWSSVSPGFSHAVVWVTRQLRLIEIWFAADPERERIYPGIWWTTRPTGSRTTPQSSGPVRIDGCSFTGIATEVEGGPDEGLARRLVAAKYQGWAEGRAPTSAAGHDHPCRSPSTSRGA